MSPHMMILDLHQRRPRISRTHRNAPPAFQDRVWAEFVQSPHEFSCWEMLGDMIGPFFLLAMGSAIPICLLSLGNIMGDPWLLGMYVLVIMGLAVGLPTLWIMEKHERASGVYDKMAKSMLNAWMSAIILETQARSGWKDFWTSEMCSQVELHMKEGDLDHLRGRWTQEAMRLEALRKDHAQNQVRLKTCMRNIDRLGHDPRACDSPRMDATVALAESLVQDVEKLVHEIAEQKSYVRMLSEAGQVARESLLAQKAKITAAARDLDRAQREEKMAITRISLAREISERTPSHTRSIDSLVKSMQDDTNRARVRTHVAREKASLLTPNRPEDDPNIAEAMAFATGSPRLGRFARKVAAF